MKKEKKKKMNIYKEDKKQKICMNIIDNKLKKKRKQHLMNSFWKKEMDYKINK